MKSIGNPFPEQARYGLLRFSLLSALIAAVGSVAILASAYGIAHAFGLAPATDSAPDMPVTALQLFGAVVFAPAVETAALAVMISGLSSFLRSPLAIAALAALAWGGLHALVDPFWFFGTVWSFFVFGYGYLCWRPRSLGHGFAAAAIPHTLVNTFALVVAAVSPSA